MLFVSGFKAWLNEVARKAAEAGWEFGGAPTPVIVAGVIMWVVLMEALRRTGGWSLMLSVLPFTLYPLFADSAYVRPTSLSNVNVPSSSVVAVRGGTEPSQTSAFAMPLPSGPTTWPSR